jgi:hypothetical protein
MPTVYGSYKTGADIYKDPNSKKFYILEWNPQTSETYKKFISFKPSTNNNKTIKVSQSGKIKNRNYKKTKRNQKGGQHKVPGEMSWAECENSVLYTQSYKTILAQLNLADTANISEDIESIKNWYSQNFAVKRLVDVIYDLPAHGQISSLGQKNTKPKMCWDHGSGKPNSITGSAIGIHVYIADVGSNEWHLVGLFKRMSPGKEIEVFRMKPIIGQCYASAKYTRTTGIWPNQKYYTSNQLIYMGRFVESKTYGGGNGARYYEYFDNNNGEINELEYDYDGMTCLIEVPCQNYGG